MVEFVRAGNPAPFSVTARPNFVAGSAGLRGQINLRARLAAAMLGLDYGDKITTPVQFGEVRMSARITEKRPPPGGSAGTLMVRSGIRQQSLTERARRRKLPTRAEPTPALVGQIPVDDPAQDRRVTDRTEVAAVGAGRFVVAEHRNFRAGHAGHPLDHDPLRVARIP